MQPSPIEGQSPDRNLSRTDSHAPGYTDSRAPRYVVEKTVPNALLLSHGAVIAAMTVLAAMELRKEFERH